MSALLHPEHPEAPLFSDGIGDRVVAADGATGELVQVLRINPALTAVPSFEFALRERVARLANFRHGYYARVRRVDRTHTHATALSIVSDHVEGTRLSEILRVAAERGLQLDLNAAICLIRQLVPAVALLHENARDVAHGLLAPERLIVTPHARLVIAEHVMGAAIEQMQYGRERLWHEFRVAMPPSAGIARFDQRCDVAGIGVVALSLVLGRPLTKDEYPRGLHDLLNDALERSALGDEQPLSPPLRTWLARALQVDVRRAFASAPEALAALEQLGAEGTDYVAAPVALETFLSRYIAALLAPPPPKEAPIVPPAAPVTVTPGTVVPQAAAPVAAARMAPERVERLPPAPAAVPAAPAVPVPDKDIERFSLDLEEEQLAAPAQEPPPLFNREKPFGTPGPAAKESRPGQFTESETEIEEEMAAVAAAAPSARRPRRKWLAVAAVLVVLASGGFAGLKVFSRPVAAPAMATLSVQSNPPGVALFIDGVDRGMTPARVTLAPGAHILELRGRGVPRVIPITLTAGADVSQYLEFVEAPLPEQPMTVPEPAPAAAAAGPAAAPATDAPAAPLAGWISVKMPFSAEIREGGRLLGTTDADRLMLGAGRHELEFVNTTLAFSVTRNVHVTAGKVTPVSVALPRGVINLNASPWAEVWIDGQRVGETPIGNLAVTIGPHEIVFRHPQLGEKRHAVSVTGGAPVRLSIDMK